MALRRPIKTVVDPPNPFNPGTLSQASIALPDIVSTAEHAISCQLEEPL